MKGRTLPSISTSTLKPLCMLGLKPGSSSLPAAACDNHLLRSKRVSNWSQVCPSAIRGLAVSLELTTFQDPYRITSPLAAAFDHQLLCFERLLKRTQVCSQPMSPGCIIASHNIQRSWSYTFSSHMHDACRVMTVHSRGLSEPGQEVLLRVTGTTTEIYATVGTPWRTRALMRQGPGTWGRCWFQTGLPSRQCNQRNRPP